MIVKVCLCRGKGPKCQRLLTAGKQREIATLISNLDRLLEYILNMDEDAVAAAIEKVHRAGTALVYDNTEQTLRSFFMQILISG